MIRDVRDGDIVLHWHKELMGEPGIVGWSQASGLPEVSVITWQSRGTAGRAHGPSGEEPAWRIRLTGYAPILSPVTLSQVRGVEAQLRSITTGLEETHSKPLYLPFAFSDRRAVRAAQGYLVTFPHQYLPLFPELGGLPHAQAIGRPPAKQPTRQGASPGDSGYLSDPRIRKAIERHAVVRATEYFEELGYQVEDVGSYRSYDLHVTDSREERRVEVKGSSGTAASVELTDGEVRNAESHELTDLFIVDHIQWQRAADGSIETWGGVERVLHDWTPDANHLEPTRYRYRVPDKW